MTYSEKTTFRQYSALRKSITVLVWSLIVIAAISGSWAGYLRLTGNIHEVEAGRVYRSGQLSAAQLSSLISEKGIRTVINLRGESRDQPWYIAETEVAQNAGVKHISLSLSANSEPDPDRLVRLIDILRTAEAPVLIHCEGGADRSGLASALYELKIARKSAQEADRQLSFRYGHFPWLASRTGAMDRTFWRVVSQQSITAAQ